MKESQQTTITEPLADGWYDAKWRQIDEPTAKDKREFYGYRVWTRTDGQARMIEQWAYGSFNLVALRTDTIVLERKVKHE